MSEPRQLTYALEADAEVDEWDPDDDSNRDEDGRIEELDLWIGDDGNNDEEQRRRECQDRDY